LNDIVKPLTRDGLVGWDRFGQLWLWQVEGERRSGTIIADVRGKTCAVCGYGWKESAESLGNQHYWRNRAEWAHETCYIRYLAIQEFDFWWEALVGAHFIFGREDNPKTVAELGPALESLPNQYWGPNDPWGAGRPWYRARLLKKLPNGDNASLGRTLKLGSRKRVYHLEIEPGEGPYDAVAASRLFEPEDVTKTIRADGMMVHAWGDLKAKEYLRRFSEVLGLTK
jgi:ribosomal protein L37E